MSLIACKECGKDISSEAQNCPHCGIKIKRKGSGCITVVIIVLVIMIIFLSIKENSSKNNVVPDITQPPISSDIIKKSDSAFGSLTDVTTIILKDIQCYRQSITPADYGLGPIFGCYNDTEEVRLWINCKPENPSEVLNIKLSVLKYNGRKMDIVGKIWAGIISDIYGGKNAEQIKKTFQKCPIYKVFNVGKLKISINSSKEKGAIAEEHLMVISENDLH